MHSRVHAAQCQPQQSQCSAVCVTEAPHGSSQTPCHPSDEGKQVRDADAFAQGATIRSGNTNGRPTQQKHLIKAVGFNGILDADEGRQVLILHFDQASCHACMLLSVRHNDTNWLPDASDHFGGKAFLIMHDRAHVIAAWDITSAKVACHSWFLQHNAALSKASPATLVHCLHLDVLSLELLGILSFLCLAAVL